MVKREFNGDVKVRTTLHFSHSNCTHCYRDDDFSNSCNKIIFVLSDDNDHLIDNNDNNTNNRKNYRMIILVI